jgi:transcription elongation GreA/GreB family factor
MAYGTAIVALSVAYMANNSVKSLHKRDLRNTLSNLKYVAILVLLLGIMTGFLFYTTWPDALIEDERLISTDQEGVKPRLGCIVDGQGANEFNFYNKATCEEYIPAPVKGDTDLISARLTSIEWKPGIGFFIVLIGSVLTGGGTLYILGNVDEEWQAILKKQELIERQQKIQESEVERNKDMLQEFEQTEQSLKDAEKKIEEVRVSASNIDYEGIEDLENELDRLTALNQSVNTLNNSLESKLKSARLATSEVEKRARMVEKELKDDLSAKSNLEKEIEDMRGKQENDMRLSDRMTREISSLRKMSEDAEERALKAENKLKVEKPETVSALESYDSVKAAYDKTVEEKNNLEKEIMELEQQILEGNERERAATAEKNDAAQRRNEMNREVKLMEKNKKRINDKFSTLTTNLEKAKKELAETRERAAVALSELDLERETIVELEQKAEEHRTKEKEIVEVTDSMKELQEQVNEQKETNEGIEDELKAEIKRKKKTEGDLKALEKASKQVSQVMETLKKQFDTAKDELGVAIEDRSKAERLLEAEKGEHEKLKEDLEFLQGTTIGNEEDAERKIKAMNIETPKASEQAREMREEADSLTEMNKELEDKIKEARLESVENAGKEPETASATGAAIGSSLLVKNLAKETEHNFQLVNPDQADPKSGKIPLSNPIAKALEGAKEGDEVQVGPNTFKIIKLS